MTSSAAEPAVALIENRILYIRGHKVLLYSDLAGLYEVETKVLNQSVKRNLFRFPADFMFRLTEQEAKAAVLSHEQSTSPNPTSKSNTKS